MTIYVNRRNHIFKKAFTDEGVRHKLLEELFANGWFYFKEDEGFTNANGDGQEQFVASLEALPKNIQNELRMNLLALRDQRDFGFPKNKALYEDLNDVKTIRFVLCWLVARGVNLYSVKVDDNTEFINFRQDILMSNDKNIEKLLPENTKNAYDNKKYFSVDDIIRSIWNNEILTIVDCDDFAMTSKDEWDNPDFIIGIKSLGNRQDMTQAEIDDYMLEHYLMKPAMIKYY